MSSRDPNKAMFSYIYPNLKGTLRGPFCAECMNEKQSFNQKTFYSITEGEEGLPIYMHTMDGTVFYEISDLLYHNGSPTPFSFQTLSEDTELMLLSCEGVDCSQGTSFSECAVNQLQGPANCEAYAQHPSPTHELDTEHKESRERGLVGSQVRDVFPYYLDATQSDVESSEFVHFPFLYGFEPWECADHMNSQDLNRLVEPMRLEYRKVMVEMTSVLETMDISQVPIIDLVCPFCKYKTFPSALLCLIHCLTRSHLRNVTEAGLVFSRSQDYVPACELLERATNIRTPIDFHLCVGAHSSYAPIRPRSIPVKIVYYPCLLGVRPENQHSLDSISASALDLKLADWLRGMKVCQFKDHLSKILNKYKIDQFYATCIYCIKPTPYGDNMKVSKTFLQCFLHCTTSHHLCQAAAAGAVFSRSRRSRDLEPVVQLLEMARQVAAGKLDKDAIELPKMFAYADD